MEDVVRTIDRPDVRTPNDFARWIRGMPNEQRSGTLRVWGEWFGRPMDNVHVMTRCEAWADHIVLQFDQGERLTVWQPEGAQTQGRTLRIQRAARVLLTWGGYGSKPSQGWFLDYRPAGAGVIVETNRLASAGRCSLREPALELI